MKMKMTPSWSAVTCAARRRRRSAMCRGWTPWRGSTCPERGANISNASGVPGLGLYIELYQGVLKKPERLARALHEKHFFYHLYRYRQLMQWYNEAGKKHEAGLENLPQIIATRVIVIQPI